MTSPPSSFNIAIVGAGNIFGPQFSGLRLVSGVDVKLAGIYDEKKGKAQEAAVKHAVAATFPNSRIFPSYEAILDDSDVNVVLVLTPPGSHKDLSIQAMYAGKHVICEKPMANSLADCKTMIGVAKIAMAASGDHV